MERAPLFPPLPFAFVAERISQPWDQPSSCPLSLRSEKEFVPSTQRTRSFPPASRFPPYRLRDHLRPHVMSQALFGRYHGLLRSQCVAPLTPVVDSRNRVLITCHVLSAFPSQHPLSQMQRGSLQPICRDLQTHEQVSCSLSKMAYAMTWGILGQMRSSFLLRHALLWRIVFPSHKMNVKFPFLTFGLEINAKMS